MTIRGNGFRYVIVMIKQLNFEMLSKINLIYNNLVQTMAIHTRLQIVIGLQFIIQYLMLLSISSTTELPLIFIAKDDATGELMSSSHVEISSIEFLSSDICCAIVYVSSPNTFLDKNY
jgi:hypothetical protein